MKKNYTTPDVQYTLLSSADVITASGDVIGMEEINLTGPGVSFGSGQ